VFHIYFKTRLHVKGFVVFGELAAASASTPRPGLLFSYGNRHRIC